MDERLYSVTLPNGGKIVLGCHTGNDYPGAWGSVERIHRDDRGCVLFISEAGNQMRRVWVSDFGMVSVEMESHPKRDQDR